MCSPLSSPPGRRSRLIAPHAREFDRPVGELQVAYGRWTLEVLACQAALPRRLVAAERVVVDELVGSLSPHLISTAARISARLGYRRDDEIGSRK